MCGRAEVSTSLGAKKLANLTRRFMMEKKKEKKVFTKEIIQKQRESGVREIHDPGRRQGRVIRKRLSE